MSYKGLGFSSVMCEYGRLNCLATEQFPITPTSASVLVTFSRKSPEFNIDFHPWSSSRIEFNEPNDVSIELSIHTKHRVQDGVHLSTGLQTHMLEQ
jgi:hypothetical protein